MGSFAESMAEGIQRVHSRRDAAREWCRFAVTMLIEKFPHEWRALVAHVRIAVEVLNREFPDNPRCRIVSTFERDVLTLTKTSPPLVEVECTSDSRLGAIWRKVTTSDTQCSKALVAVESLQVIYEEDGHIHIKRDGTDLSQKQLEEFFIAPFRNAFEETK